MLKRNKEYYVSEARKIQWHSPIKLFEDYTTPGSDLVCAKLAIIDSLGMPNTLTGLRVLDIGAWDGFYAFEMEKRGAEVVAIDHVDGSATGFALCAEALRSKVRFEKMNIYDVTSAALGHFDVVLCLGVLYHLRHVMLGLDALRSVMKDDGTLYVETAAFDRNCILERGRSVSLVDQYPQLSDAALLQIYPTDELAHDDTNVFAPNLAGLNALLKMSEFEVTNSMLGTGPFANRAFAKARALKDPRIAYYRERDVSTLEGRHFYKR